MHIFHYISRVSYLHSLQKLPDLFCLIFLANFIFNVKVFTAPMTTHTTLPSRMVFWGVSWQGDPLSQRPRPVDSLEIYWFGRSAAPVARLLILLFLVVFYIWIWFQNLLPSTVAPLGYILHTGWIRIETLTCKICLSTVEWDHLKLGGSEKNGWRKQPLSVIKISLAPQLMAEILHLEIFAWIWTFSLWHILWTT